MMKTGTKRTIAGVAGAALMIVYPLAMFSCGRTQHFELSRFLGPDMCGGCHAAVADQWKNSMHNLSHFDPVYTAVAKHLRKGLTDPDEIAEAESCVKCHTPVGFVTGNPTKVSDDLDRVPDIAKQGIQCDYCHSATGARKMYNNDIRLDPGHGMDNAGTKRGPFTDSHSEFHKSAYSKFHTESGICGTCHDVRHVVYGTKLETTYEEWLGSPYNSSDPNKRIPCQGCHMYQRPGVPATGSTPRPQNPGEAAGGGPQRAHIYTHYFVGANAYVPNKFGDAVKARMAEERLKNAAALTIIDSELSKGIVKVEVKNIGAGHKLPTGLTDVRQMWLEVVVTDAAGRELFSSGKLGRDGTIPAGAVVYNTVFGDGKGKAVANLAKAREVLKDYRIPPLGSVVETFTVPNLKAKTATVTVALKYRSAPQELLDAVFGAGKIVLPVTTMAEAKKQIAL